MQIEIKEQNWVIKTIDIDLPYYYKQDLTESYGKYIVYGKIEASSYTTVTISNDYDRYGKIEIESESYASIKESNLGCYFQKKYVSSKEEFNEAFEKVRTFLNNLKHL